MIGRGATTGIGAKSETSLPRDPPNPPQRGRDSGLQGRCSRCDGNHNRSECTQPVTRCPYRFPNGEVCGKDHHIKHCWYKNPKLCYSKKIRDEILEKIADSASKANEEQDDGVVQHYLATAEDEYYEGESADGIEEA